MTLSREKKWPKTPVLLTEDEKKIKNQFMVQWHEILPNKYALIERFNHFNGFKREGVSRTCRILEIGAGLGAHMEFEDTINNDYHALELRPDMAERAQRRFPAAKVLVGDIQKPIDLPEGSFDRIIAVHVLEHLPDLPEALRRIKLLLKPTGFCEFIIPCEGSLAYSLARRISAKRVFEKTYKISYEKFIKSEHINTCKEILEELDVAGFYTTWKRYFPFRIPLIFCNLVIGLRCSIDPESAA